MLQRQSIFSSNAISNRLIDDCSYLPPLANIVQSYIKPEDYLAAIVTSENTKRRDWKNQIPDYIFMLVENKKIDDANEVEKMLDYAFSSSSKPDSAKRFALFKEVISIVETPAAELVHACLLISSNFKEHSNDSIKTYINTLIEKNHHHALRLLLQKKPNILSGELTRHLKYPAPDGLSKINYIDLAIVVGSVESLNVILRFSDTIWVSGTSTPVMQTSLDFAVLAVDHKRAPECVQQLLLYFLKLLWDGTESCLRQPEFDGCNTLRQYQKQMQHFLIENDGFNRAKTHAEKRNRRDLIPFIEKAIELLDLPIEKFAEARQMLENEWSSKKTPQVADESRHEFKL